VTEVSGARAPQTIYVALLDEGVAVWRPVQGIELASLKFRIAVDQPYERSFERWEFEPGTLVECEPRELSGEACTVAVRRCGEGASER
jgi:hypothetical protein